MPRFTPFLFSIVGLFVGEECLAQMNTATYEVVFESVWSASTHPIDFPGNPHFSGLIGGTHDDRVFFWVPGEVASDGIESMAETGQKSLLTAEVEAAINDGTAEHVLSGGGINPSPGSRSLTFDISADKPLVTLVSMVAPSPDWFVGVHGLNMREAGKWRDTVTVTLDVYDAGTDSGASYASPNDDTDPAQPITILNTGPFAQRTVVGTYTFTRLEAVSTSEELPDGFEVAGPYPNPASDRFTLSLPGASSEPVHITLHDVTGRMVHERMIPQAEAQSNVDIDVSLLPVGVYIVRMNMGERLETRSVVVLR